MFSPKLSQVSQPNSKGAITYIPDGGQLNPFRRRAATRKTTVRPITFYRNWEDSQVLEKSIDKENANGENVFPSEEVLSQSPVPILITTPKHKQGGSASENEVESQELYIPEDYPVEKVNISIRSTKKDANQSTTRLASIENNLKKSSDSHKTASKKGVKSPHRSRKGINSPKFSRNNTNSSINSRKSIKSPAKHRKSTNTRRESIKSTKNSPSIFSNVNFSRAKAILERSLAKSKDSDEDRETDSARETGSTREETDSAQEIDGARETKKVQRGENVKRIDTARKGYSAKERVSSSETEITDCSDSAKEIENVGETITSRDGETNVISEEDSRNTEVIDRNKDIIEDSVFDEDDVIGSSQEPDVIPETQEQRLSQRARHVSTESHGVSRDGSVESRDHSDDHFQHDEVMPETKNANEKAVEHVSRSTRTSNAESHTTNVESHTTNVKSRETNVKSQATNVESQVTNDESHATNLESHTTVKYSHKKFSQTQSRTDSVSIIGVSSIGPNETTHKDLTTRHKPPLGNESKGSKRRANSKESGNVGKHKIMRLSDLHKTSKSQELSRKRPSTSKESDLFKRKPKIKKIKTQVASTPDLRRATMLSYVQTPGDSPSYLISETPSTRAVVDKQGPVEKSKKTVVLNTTIPVQPPLQRDTLRVWQGPEGCKRKLSDAVELDIILNCFEEVTQEFKSELDSRPIKKAVNHFGKLMQADLRTLIENVHRKKQLNASYVSSQRIMRRKRKELLAVKMDQTEKLAQLAEIKKRLERSGNSKPVKKLTNNFCANFKKLEFVTKKPAVPPRKVECNIPTLDSLPIDSLGCLERLERLAAM